MSMLEYPVHGQGLVINLDKDEGRPLVEAYLKANPGVLDEDEEIDSCVISELIYNICDFFGGFGLQGNDENNLWLYGLQTSCGQCDSCDPEVLRGNYLIWEDRKSSKMFGNPYKTLDDLLAVYEKKFEGILPDDFDYASHIGLVTGTYWG